MEKKCPHCGQEIQGGSILCKYCGKPITTLVKSDTDEKLQGVSLRTIPQIVKIKKPLLGIIGILLLVVGVGIVLFGQATIGFPFWLILIFVVGVILLVSALVSGNIKLSN